MDCSSPGSSAHGILQASVLEWVAKTFSRASFLVAQMVKNLPAMQETQVRSMGQEDPLQKAMASHSRILAWEIPDKGVWWAVVHGVAKSQTRLSN